MKTRIKEVHSEEYSNGSRALGILLNYGIELENENWKESFAYIFRQTEEGGKYIFFNTMFDMWSYLLYSENKMRIGYMTEETYDSLFDAPYIDGTFSENISWV